MLRAISISTVCCCCCFFQPAASAWSLRWRSLQNSVADACQSTLIADLGMHFAEAAVDFIFQEASSDASCSSTITDTCGLSHKMLETVSTCSNDELVTVGPRTQEELYQTRQLRRLVASMTQPKALAAVPSLVNFSRSPQLRGYYDESAKMILTSGPSLWELADATYHLLLNQSWSYVAIVYEAADFGAQQLVQVLQQMATADGRVCFPFIRGYSSVNVTTLAETLKDFVYKEKGVPRMSVVYAGSPSLFVELWEHLSGSVSAFADLEKRYQFALVGDAFGSFHAMTTTSYKKYYSLGTLFVFPGILDPKPTTDPVAKIFYALASTGSWPSAFSSLSCTKSRLQGLKSATSADCSWSSSSSSVCYDMALRYDYVALSLVVALADGAPTLTNAIQFESLRVKEINFPSLMSKFSLLSEFTNQGFTNYSFAKGLYHSTNGYWQPIVKVYQSQLDGSTATLKKVGEVRVRNAGQSTQSYERDFNEMLFYKFDGTGSATLPKLQTDSRSRCPTSCPECLPQRQVFEFQEGDLYIGALVPVHNSGSDVYGCSDGTFRSKSVGGYEFATAFKFVIEWANLVSRGVSPVPSRFAESQLDRNFLLALRQLTAAATRTSSRPLRWGFVILDTCYSAPYTVRNLAALLEGRLGTPSSFRSSQIVGFIGALSSTQSIAASRLLSLYHLPLVSYGSTSTALTDYTEFPYVLRTLASDTAFVEAMVSTLKQYGVNYVSVVHGASAYGGSLWEKMQSTARREEICIAGSYSYSCAKTDSVCKGNLLSSLVTAGARYVLFLSNLNDFKSLMAHSFIERDIKYLTFLTTESVGTSEEAFLGRKNAGVGTISIKLSAPPSPAFAEYQKSDLGRLPDSATAISEWQRLHFEGTHRCRLADSFVQNPLYSQTCSAATVAATSVVAEVEPRSPFVIDATATLVLGALVAMPYRCTVVADSPACPDFFKNDSASLKERANLVIYGETTATSPSKPQKFHGSYGGSSWQFQKIFDQRMGRMPMTLWQYRREGSTNFAFRMIGSYDGASDVKLSVSASDLFASERQLPTSPGCRTHAECAAAGCSVNAEAAGGGTLGLFGLLGLLIIPGILAGILVAHRFGSRLQSLYSRHYCQAEPTGPPQQPGQEQSTDPGSYSEPQNVSGSGGVAVPMDPVRPTPKKRGNPGSLTRQEDGNALKADGAVAAGVGYDNGTAGTQQLSPRAEGNDTNA